MNQVLFVSLIVAFVTAGCASGSPRPVQTLHGRAVPLMAEKIEASDDCTATFTTARTVAARQPSECSESIATTGRGALALETGAPADLGLARSDR